MEDTLLSPQTAIQGLIVLAAIPTAMIALWADYFGRYLDEVALSEPDFDRAVEHQTIRMAGLLGIFLQVLLFLCSAHLRESAPTYLHFLPIVGISLQSWIQARLDARLRGYAKPGQKAGELAPTFKDVLRGAESAAEDGNATAASAGRGNGSRSRAPSEHAFSQTSEMSRAFFWSLVAGGLYATVMISSLMLAALAIRFGTLGAAASTGVMFAATVIGVLGGLGANFALSPYFMRKMMNAKQAAAPEQQAVVNAAFAGSGFSAPQLYVVDPGKSFAGAVLAGLGGGRGVFAPALFITRALMDTLTPEQLHAVVAHERSHLQLAHLRKRLFYAGTLVITVATAASLLVVLSHWLTQGQGSEFVGLGAGVAAFFIAFNRLKRQSRLHEIQADAYCVAKLGVPVDALVSALKKLHGINEPLSRRANATVKHLAALGHPELEARIALIERLAPAAAADRDQRAA